MSSPNQPHDVQIVEVESSAGNNPARWTPIVGEETISLLNHFVSSSGLPEDSKESVQSEAEEILARCIPPTQEHSETGLVIGYVQSGKTMSFTTVAALARDNGYQLIIVITGISKPLYNQSTTRLKQDLRLLTRSDRKWKHFENPSPRHNITANIEETLADWREADVPDAERQTVLITVMKNHRHLNNLIRVLSAMDLREVPALVIDDEADQAGLNTSVRDGSESTTYRRLLQLRQCLPQHTLLQYTATPQAPLLITLIDVLSPKFAELLTPGPDYVGGREFFLEHPNLVRTIPTIEVPTRDYPLNEPPASLLTAMRIFFLGVAAGYVSGHSSTGNRSMMVHPSQLTVGHGQYFRWAEQIKEHWKNVFSLADSEPDKQELIEEFRTAYDDLSSTVEDVPTFEELVNHLPRAIRKTRVTEVNASRGQTPVINWKDDYAHILVGGQAMDRGFTVEGLTVTYMPRGLGVGNADTIQQRARFFGYKRGYLGYCRVYLEGTARDAYSQYVNHEEDIRERLIEHRATGRPLSEWKRAFFLTPSLKPTRDNVLLLDYMQDTISDDWYAPKAPHESEDAIAENRIVVNEFLAGLDLQDDEGDARRTEIQRHKVDDNVPLRVAFEQLLTRLRMTRPNDSQRFTGLLLQVQAYLEMYPDAPCAIYLISGGTERERTLNNDEVENVFQGANPNTGYPGDREIKSAQRLTIQIRNMKLIGAEREYLNVPVVAVWMPREMSETWVVQEERRAT